jgi:hypothetical protein
VYTVTITTAAGTLPPNWRPTREVVPGDERVEHYPLVHGKHRKFLTFADAESYAIADAMHSWGSTIKVVNTLDRACPEHEEQELLRQLDHADVLIADLEKANTSLVADAEGFVDRQLRRDHEIVARDIEIANLRGRIDTLKAEGSQVIAERDDARKTVAKCRDADAKLTKELDDARKAVKATCIERDSAISALNDALDKDRRDDQDRIWPCRQCGRENVCRPGHQGQTKNLRCSTCRSSALVPGLVTAAHVKRAAEQVVGEAKTALLALLDVVSP